MLLRRYSTTTRMAEPHKLDIATIEAVIFDLNGTIINDGAYHDAAFEEFFRRHDVNISMDEYRQRYYARKNEEIMPELLQRTLTPAEIAALSQEKEDIYHDLYGPRIGEVAGFSSLVAMLKAQGKKIGLATSSGPTNLAFTFEHLRFQGLFDAVVDGWEVTRSKPDPEIYLKTAERLSVVPDKCLVFEDAPVGVLGARRAGMRVVGLLTSHDAEQLCEAEACIHDFTEILL